MSIIDDMKQRFTIADESVYTECHNENPHDVLTYASYGTHDFKQPDWDPIQHGPRDSSAGGVVYFGNGLSKALIKAQCDIFGVRTEQKDFALFIRPSSQPGNENRLAQMRIVPKFDLRFFYGGLSEKNYEAFPEQPYSLLDAITTFTESERKRWGTFFADSPKLDGLFGGDGNYAREQLGFGMLVEKDGIMQIWSRAWLVHK